MKPWELSSFQRTLFAFDPTVELKDEDAHFLPAVITGRITLFIFFTFTVIAVPSFHHRASSLYWLASQLFNPVLTIERFHLL
ncbi:hypothetical protein K1719_030571 [Acacia pycnantha]|nr:hypothetical protein K1719_030571 [Acacia pycnantha]